MEERYQLVSVHMSHSCIYLIKINVISESPRSQQRDFDD